MRLGYAVIIIRLVVNLDLGHKIINFIIIFGQKYIVLQVLTAANGESLLIGASKGLVECP